MKCKIEKVWTLISPDGIAYRRFRIRFAKNIFFINEIDFRSHTQLIIILDEQIILKEPLDKNFDFIKKQEKKKSLVIIKPKSDKFNDEPDFPDVDIDELKKKAVSSGKGMDIDAFLRRHAKTEEEPSVPASDILEKSGEKEITRGTPVNINKIKEALKNSKRNISELTEEDVAKKSSNEVAKPQPNLNDFLKANIESKAAQKTDDSNIAFFKEMILLASHEKVDSSSKNRLFNLIGTELQKTKSAEITILEKIQDDLTNLIKGKKPPEPPPVKPKPSHAPRATFNFLRGFRYPVESPFKFLTHSQANETDELGNIIPINHDEITKILNEAKNHPALIRDFRNQKAVNFEPIHNDIREKAKDLINSFEVVLISPENSPDHPYETSAEYRRKCENFKQNFRIGNSERETNLRNLILFAAQTKLHRIRPNITFHNGEDDFDRHAVFFSWKPALDNTFKYIFSEIESNSNINGSREFEAEKRITIKLKDEPMQEDIIHLDIIDHESICPDVPDQLLLNLRSSKPTQLNNLWGLCNWSIIADFTSGPFKVHIISDNHNEYDVAPIVRLENPVGAFMHRITFYKP